MLSQAPTAFGSDAVRKRVDQTTILGQAPIPGSAPLSARLRKSPYFEQTLQAGVAEFTVYNRMLMPLIFDGGHETEYKALTEDAVIWDVAAERQVELKGPQMPKNSHSI
jgi:hypothetical protein